MRGGLGSFLLENDGSPSNAKKRRPPRPVFPDQVERAPSRVACMEFTSWPGVNVGVELEIPPPVFPERVPGPASRAAIPSVFSPPFVQEPPTPVYPDRSRATAPTAVGFVTPSPDAFVLPIVVLPLRIDQARRPVGDVTMLPQEQGDEGLILSCEAVFPDRHRQVPSTPGHVTPVPEGFVLSVPIYPDRARANPVLPLGIVVSSSQAFVLPSVVTPDRLESLRRTHGEIALLPQDQIDEGLALSPVAVFPSRFVAARVVPGWLTDFPEHEEPEEPILGWAPVFPDVLARAMPAREGVVVWTFIQSLPAVVFQDRIDVPVRLAESTIALVPQEQGDEGLILSCEAVFPDRLTVSSRVLAQWTEVPFEERAEFVQGWFAVFPDRVSAVPAALFGEPSGTPILSPTPEVSFPDVVLGRHVTQPSPFISTPIASTLPPLFFVPTVQIAPPNIPMDLGVAFAPRVPTEELPLGWVPVFPDAVPAPTFLPPTGPTSILIVRVGESIFCTVGTSTFSPDFGVCVAVPDVGTSTFADTSAMGKGQRLSGQAVEIAAFGMGKSPTPFAASLLQATFGTCARIVLMGATSFVGVSSSAAGSGVSGTSVFVGVSGKGKC